MEFKDVSVWEIVRLFECTSPERRMRVVAYQYDFYICLRDRTWTDMSPVPGCLYYGCEDCYADRHVTRELQEDPYCPRKFNEHSLEPCLFADEADGTGLCDMCRSRTAEFGCGWGDHACPLCIADCHRCDHVATPCGECGPCDNPACVEADNAGLDRHCRVVCPTTHFGG
jgi:hypothetical protein